MPHSTRRYRQPPGKPKRMQVALSDGWTIVTHSSSRMQSETAVDASPAPAYPTKIVKGLTVEKLLAEYNGMKARWQTCACKQALGDLLWRWGRGTGITEGICLATGSFSVDWDGRQRALWQLVCFLETVGMVSTASAQPKLYAQDPRFNPLDETFLYALGFTVLRINEATERITQYSFVYAPFLQWEVLLPDVLKGKDPEIFVGNDIKDMVGILEREGIRKPLESLSAQDCIDVAETFQRGRESAALPDFDLHPHALEGLRIYWRRDEAEE